MQRWEEKRGDPEFDRLSSEKLEAITPLQEIEYRQRNRHQEVIDSAGQVPTKILQFIQSKVLLFFNVFIILLVVTKPIYTIIYTLSVFSLVGFIIVLRIFMRTAALKKHAFELNELSRLAKEAQTKRQAIENDYDNRIREHCDTYPSYPADWAERRRLVLSRDDFTCTACGWSRVVHGNARELHVHHVKSLSSGGSNLSSNLVTLCHICHQQIDSNHAGVRRLNPATKFRRKW